LQGNIIDDVFPLVFYDPSATQWLVHEESAHIGFYNTYPIFYEYKVEEDVQSSATSFTKISRRNMSIFDHHDTKSELAIEEHISKVDFSKNVISAPVYVSYEGSDEGFQIDELFSFVLEGTELDHCEQEPIEVLACDEVVVLPPFSSSESQAEKWKSPGAI
jgi:hypothetical protein